MIGVHEGAGTVIDGLAADRHIVGVHHAVDETEAQPLRDQRRLPRDHRIQQCAIGIFGLRRIRVVPRDDVIGEDLHALHILAGGEILERADADMALRHAHHDGAGQRLFAHGDLTGRHGGECTRRGNAQRCHRLADDIFAQHRSQRRASVAAPREGRRSCAFQLNVVANADRGPSLRPARSRAVTQLRHEIAELMPGIGSGQRARFLPPPHFPPAPRRLRATPTRRDRGPIPAPNPRSA